MRQIGREAKLFGQKQEERVFADRRRLSTGGHPACEVRFATVLGLPPLCVSPIEPPLPL